MLFVKGSLVVRSSKKLQKKKESFQKAMNGGGLFEKSRSSSTGFLCSGKNGQVELYFKSPRRLRLPENGNL